MIVIVMQCLIQIVVDIVIVYISIFVFFLLYSWILMMMPMTFFFILFSLMRCQFVWLFFFFGTLSPKSRITRRKRCFIRLRVIWLYALNLNWLWHNCCFGKFYFVFYLVSFVDGIIYNLRDVVRCVDYIYR